MHLIRCAVASWIVCAFAGSFACAADADPRESLDTIIPAAIKHLEAKEYGKLLKLVVSEEELKKLGVKPAPAK